MNKLGWNILKLVISNMQVFFLSKLILMIITRSAFFYIKLGALLFDPLFNSRHGSTGTKVFLTLHWITTKLWPDFYWRRKHNCTLLAQKRKPKHKGKRKEKNHMILVFVLVPSSRPVARWHNDYFVCACVWVASENRA